MVGKLEKKLLIDLYKSSKGLQDKTLANRYTLSVSYLLDFIEKFLDIEFISYDGLIINIENKGIKYLLSKNVITLSDDKYSNIPQWMLGENISVNRPYIPKKDSLDLDELRSDDDSHN